MLGTPFLKARQHSQHGLPRSLDGAVDKRTHKWEKHSAKHKALKKQQHAGTYHGCVTYVTAHNFIHYTEKTAQVHYTQNCFCCCAV